MMHGERDVRSLLRPSEHLLLTLKGSTLRRGSEGNTESETTQTPVGDSISRSSSEDTHVILAVVGHVDRATGESGRLIFHIIYPTILR